MLETTTGGSASQTASRRAERAPANRATSNDWRPKIAAGTGASPKTSSGRGERDPEGATGTIAAWPAAHTTGGDTATEGIIRRNGGTSRAAA